MGESLREAACLGNLQAVEKLIANGASINSQNSMNGWTALHWACKRNHTHIMQYLIANGADVNIKTFNDETTANLTTSEEALQLLGCPVEKRLMVDSCSNLPIVPHYLKHPLFPYGDFSQYEPDIKLPSGSNKVESIVATKQQPDCITQECTSSATALLLKLRVQGSQESDFIEMEVPSLCYQSLLKSCAEELEVEVSRIAKIRKLPDVLIRNDCDVKRMKSGQEIEVVILL